MPLSHLSDQELQAERARLQERIAAIRADYARGLPADFAEQAVELENAEVLAGIARAANEALAGIEREIQRRKLG